MVESQLMAMAVGSRITAPVPRMRGQVVFHTCQKFFDHVRNPRVEGMEIFWLKRWFGDYFKYVICKILVDIRCDSP